MCEKPEIVYGTEHKTLDLSKVSDHVRNDLREIVGGKSYDPERSLPLLGLDWDGRSRSDLKCGYFVGSVWIRSGESVLSVSPKISGIDFRAMLSACVLSGIPDMDKELSRIVEIDYDAPPLPAEVRSESLLLFVVLRFVARMEKIAPRLRRAYSAREETLHSKVRGRLLVGATVARCFSACRFDNLMCSRNEFLADNPENRVLKRALRVSLSYLGKALSFPGIKQLYASASAILRMMSEVKDLPARMLSLRVDSKRNPFHAEYPELLRLGRLIIRNMDTTLSGRAERPEVGLPPVAINMPLLFELYTYSLLRKSYGRQIQYHLSTYGNEVDFIKLDERLIIDTKYITGWTSKGGERHENVRQLSGYARNIRLRSRILGAEKALTHHIIDCMVIYPDIEGVNGFTDGEALTQRAEAVSDYVRFRYLGLRLPVVESTTSRR